MFTYAGDGGLHSIHDSVTNETAAQYTYDSWGNILTATGTLAEINPFRYRGYYYDEETNFYYLQSRYYDAAIGRFINADALASTGQGTIGYNMFCYCVCNPVNYTDLSGNMCLTFNDICGGGPLGFSLAGFDPNGSFSPGSASRDSNICSVYHSFVDIGRTILNNIEVSGGVGMGFDCSVDILDFVGAQLGMHGNYISVHIEDGEPSIGNEYSSGIEISGLTGTLGFTEYTYGKNFTNGEFEVNKGIYLDDSWTIVDFSAYIGIGFSFRIGFDIVQFLKDIS